MINGNMNDYYYGLIREGLKYFKADLKDMWENVDLLDKIKVMVCPILNNDFYQSLPFAITISESIIKNKLLKVLVFNDADYRPEYFNDYPHEHIRIRNCMDFRVFMENLSREIELKVKHGVL